MHSCMPWLNSISRKDETPQLSLGSGGATVCFQRVLVKGKHRKSLAPHFRSFSWNCRRWLGMETFLFIFAKTTTSATSTADSAVGTTLTDMPRHGKYYSV
mmetsp:Transcript_7231/g.15293  ORF Transcript_7231/g.15293 Transcript_7231/m.15293 type:complete len:100 (+) Transcript_7231:138-437(+)